MALDGPKGSVKLVAKETRSGSGDHQSDCGFDFCETFQIGFGKKYLAACPSGKNPDWLQSGRGRIV